MSARPLRFLAVAVAVLATALGAPADDGACGPPYRGFDSRLEPRPVGRLPPGLEVLGFELVGDRAVVATPDTLFALRPGEPALRRTLAFRATGFGVDREGDVWMQSEHALFRLAPEGFLPFAGTPRGRIVNGGSPQFLHVLKTASRTALVLRDRGGRELPLVSLEGPLAAATWGPEGLTAVAGERLLVWRPGAPKLAAWPVPDGLLIGARDVCRSAGGRLVVTLDRAVLHVSPELSEVLVAGFPARCRFAGETLHLLDEASGLLWTVDGLDRVGRREAATAHAALLTSGREQRQAAPHRLPEAARLLGCTAARARLTGSPAAVAAVPAVPARPAAAQAAAAANPAQGAETARALGLAFVPAWLHGASDGGLRLRIAAGSAAERSGLASGDVLLAIGGRPAGTLDEAQAALASAPAGVSLEVVVLRAGQRVVRVLAPP